MPSERNSVKKADAWDVDNLAISSKIAPRGSPLDASPSPPEEDKRVGSRQEAGHPMRNPEIVQGTGANPLWRICRDHRPM
jgi:hypothetical protein